MSALPPVIALAGPFGPILSILAAVVLLLSGRGVIAATGRTGMGSVAVRERANAVLFWGMTAAVLGFLGQCHGTYLALRSILAASEISPSVIAEGFVVSFVPALMGLAILAYALVVWACLRFLPQVGPAPSLLILLLLNLGGCGGSTAKTPGDLTRGVWAFRADPDVFLWEFSTSESGAIHCVVHDIQNGLEYMETPCSSAERQGEDTIRIAMPTGVRYEGSVNLSRGQIDGRLIYKDGSSLEAPLSWAERTEYPTLEPRPADAGPYVYRVPSVEEDGWPVGHASDRGVDPTALERVVDAIGSGEAGILKSFLAIRSGTLILEEYFHGYGPHDLAPIASCTKSISSILVGLAIQDGHIDGVDARLLSFFPRYADEAGSGWDGLTLEHLLTMSMALDWTPTQAQNLHGTGPEAFQQILARDVVGRPGEDFEYVNMNVNLLAGVLKAATGDQAEVLAEEGLFRPLGISDWDWASARTDGFNLMDGSLRLRPRDMGKIGVMMLNGGVWQERRVLNEAWIHQSLEPRLAAGPEGEAYGYLWWSMPIPDPADAARRVFFANGWGSQFILIFPEIDLVVVTTGGNMENGKHLAIGEILVRDLLPGVHPVEEERG